MAKLAHSQLTVVTNVSSQQRQSLIPRVLLLATGAVNLPLPALCWTTSAQARLLCF